MKAPVLSFLPLSPVQRAETWAPPASEPTLSPCSFQSTGKMKSEGWPLGNFCDTGTVTPIPKAHTGCIEQLLSGPWPGPDSIAQQPKVPRLKREDLRGADLRNCLAHTSHLPSSTLEDKTPERTTLYSPTMLELPGLRREETDMSQVASGSSLATMAVFPKLVPCFSVFSSL